MSGTTFGDISREHRRSFRDRIAVVDGKQRLTWAELDDRANRVANLLTGLGVGPGDRVLWMAQSSSAFLEVLVGCAKIAAMVCPVNWRQSPAELAFVLEDLAPQVVLWQHEEIGQAVAQARAGAAVEAVWLQCDGEGEGSLEHAVLAASDADPDGEVSPDEPLLVIYTAAIVDRPNGSMLTHRNLLAMGMATARVTGADHTSVFLDSGPLFHVGNFQFEAVPVFIHGGTNVFVRRVDAAEVLQIIADERVTSAFLMPPTIAEIKELNREAGLDISSLRAGPFGPVWGDALPPDTTLWGTQPGGFGQTEVAGLAVLNAYGGAGAGNAGRPSPLAQVRVVDSEGRECEVGEPGEIVVRGDLVHAGYWNRPELNAARLRSGWWHTTDLGRREPDGTLHFIGTMTRMIKSAAENIYPPEVEACLESHPAVREAALIGVPDPVFRQAVKAVVALVPGATVTETELIEHCRSRIASYKKPRSVEFVEALPRQGGAKDYDALDTAFGGGGYPGGDNV
ncbi:MAG TPA: AMP-binding protein [Actinomycetes bacterium]|nr:AMP-binding protein [Actinomycetes bacterium]